VADLELSLHKLKNRLGRPYPVVIGVVGLIMGKEKLEAESFDSYSGICILADERKLEDKATVIPAGKFACIYYRGQDHSASVHYFQKICSYIKDQGYVICGDAIERVIINEYKSNDPREYLTEIQIPICS
jgi:effector-binding domain-containing protein